MAQEKNRQADRKLLADIEALRRQVEYLRALVHTDELTGLANLRHFNQALSLEFERTRRSRRPTCLILLDIDNFKAVNDSHGHEVGNAALRHFAQLLRQGIRRLDCACRHGGDEFAVILPETNLDQGLAVASRLQELIRCSPCRSGATKLRMTASMGINVYQADDGELGEKEFVAVVDRLLYTSKRSARQSIAAP